MRIEKGKREIMSTGCSGEAALYRLVVGHSPYKRDHSLDGSFVSNLKPMQEPAGVWVGVSWNNDPCKPCSLPLL